MKLKIITVGGTIDKVYFDKKNKYEVGKPQVQVLLKEANLSVEYEILPLLAKDSLDMDKKDRSLLAKTIRQCGESHILITHGTDTMVDTAQALKDIPDKTIVLTGSISPARFRVSDAAFNLGSAVIAVQMLPPGVYIVINGKVFNPKKTKKNLRTNRFEEVPE